MNITMINGISRSNRDSLCAPVERLYSLLRESHKVDWFPIREMKLMHCCGCWDCWTKTPGICRMKDDGIEYNQSIAKSDLILYLSPVKAGFVTAETKKAMDRFIPSALPHIAIHEKECHHLKRYPVDTKLALYLLDDNGIDEEAEDIIFSTFERYRKNLRTSVFIKGRLNENNVEEVSNEISNC